MIKVARKASKKQQTTSKKQKFIRAKEYIDPETGEVVPFQEVEVEDRDFDFHKVWLQHLVNSLDGISNQRLRLAFWIINHLNKENQLIMTQRAIAEEASKELDGMSLDTVSKTMKALQTGNPVFLVKINSGAYMVNPDIIWKGSHASRMGIVFDYKDTLKENTPAEDKAPQNVTENVTESVTEGVESTDPNQMTFIGGAMNGKTNAVND